MKSTKIDSLGAQDFPCFMRYQHDGFDFIVLATNERDGTVVWVNPDSKVANRSLGETGDNWSFSESCYADRWSVYKGKILLEF